jgi:DNA-binding HxlR family transcriptional regulator
MPIAGYIGDAMAIATDQAASLDEDGEPASGTLVPEQCAVARCADVVCGKWTLLLVRDLLGGPRSFSELEQSLAGISPRTLCDRLKLLGAEGLLTRTRIKGLPPRSIYELTPSGHALAPIVEAMRVVGEDLLNRAPDPDAGADVASCCD